MDTNKKTFGRYVGDTIQALILIGASLAGSYVMYAHMMKNMFKMED